MSNKKNDFKEGKDKKEISPKQKTEISEYKFPIVVIGTSVGDFTALKGFFSSIPEKTAGYY
jgi:chemotaxis response regulator CheB